jgi:hypothetical protein
VLRLEGVNPIPDLIAIEPAAIAAETVAAGGEITLTASGFDFVEGAEVRLDGQPQETSFISGQALTAKVKTDLLATPGDHQVTVFNPPPLGGESIPGLVLTVAVSGEPEVVVPGAPGVAPTPPNGAEGDVPAAGEVVAAGAPVGDAAAAEPLAAAEVTIIVEPEAAANGTEALTDQPVVGSPANP